MLGILAAVPEGASGWSVLQEYNSNGSIKADAQYLNFMVSDRCLFINGIKIIKR
jgi:hypothetical protein